MLGPIHVEGSNFRDSQGARWKYVGVSAFGLFKRWLAPNGPDALVAPILTELRQMAQIGEYSGPITLRVFRYAAPPNAFAVNPSFDQSYFDAVRDFTNYCGNRGFYVDWTCGDAQIVLPNSDGPAGQSEHQNRFVAALVVCPNAFVQTCNEPFKNGIDVSKIIPPNWGGRLRSSGYYSDAGTWDHSLDLDFIDFHPDRSDDGGVHKWVGKLFESAVYLAPVNKPIVYGEPIGADEINQPGKRSNDPILFRQAGLAVGLVAGMTFHSTAGLASDGMGPLTKACLANWFYGVSRALTI